MKTELKERGIGLVIALVIIAVVGIGGYATIKTVQKAKVENQKMMDEAKNMMEEGEKMMAENSQSKEMLKSEVKLALDNIISEIKLDSEESLNNSTQILVELQDKLAMAYESAEEDSKAEIAELQLEVKSIADQLTEDTEEAKEDIVEKIDSVIKKIEESVDLNTNMMMSADDSGKDAMDEVDVDASGVTEITVE